MSSVCEIQAAIERLPKSEFLEIRRWTNAQETREAISATGSTASYTPDFLARQKAIFGDRVLPDSQAIFDEMRADRF